MAIARSVILADFIMDVPIRSTVRLVVWNMAPCNIKTQIASVQPVVTIQADPVHTPPTPAAAALVPEKNETHQASATVPPVSQPLVSPSLPDFAQGDGKLFVDICSGATRPLSAAILAKGGKVLAFDIL